MIERTFAALDTTRPAARPTVLNWGDSRIGNMMFRDFAPVAVLDWEMAALGPAEIDVGWMIFLNRFFEDLTHKYSLPCLEGFLQREQVKQIYAEESGRELQELEGRDARRSLRIADRGRGAPPRTAGRGPRRSRRRRFRACSGWRPPRRTGSRRRAFLGR